MTLSTVDAQLVVLEPHSSAPVADFAVPAADIEYAEVAEMAGREVAQGIIELDNDGGKYTIGDTRIDVDDKLEFRVAWEGADVGGDAGEFPAGERAAGDSTFQIGGTLIVADWNPTGPRYDSTLTLDVETFVFNRLRARTVTHGEEDVPISGSDDAHLDSVLAEHVPDVDASQLPTISETINYSADEKRAHKVVDELARIAHDTTGSSWILGADGTALTMERVGDLSPLWTADESVPAPDRTDFKEDFSNASAAGSIVNDARVEGGIDDLENVDQEQTTGGTFVTVTSSSRITHQLSPRKPEISKVHLWVKQVSGSADNLRVRLQSDDGAGNPIAIGDSDSDLTSSRIAADDLPADGEIHVRLGDHVLGPKDQPHLIIEASGSDGVDVETDGSGTPRFHTHFPKPVIVRIPSNASQAEYRVHESTYEDDGLVTFGPARDRARAELDRHAFPKLEFGPTRAASRRAHELSVADVITMDYDWLRAEGDYITTEVAHEYEGSTLDSRVTLRSTARYA